MRNEPTDESFAYRLLLFKNFKALLKKLNTESPYDPAIPFPGMQPKEFKARAQTDTSTLMFTAAASTVAKRWRQPKCPLTDE